MMADCYRRGLKCGDDLDSHMRATWERLTQTNALRCESATFLHNRQLSNDMLMMALVLVAPFSAVLTINPSRRQHIYHPVIKKKRERERKKIARNCLM